MDDSLIQTKLAFDKASEVYDYSDFQNEILVWMRKVVYSVYFKYISKGDKILELNCGTGIDALYLAKRGIRIFATDLSPQMINKLKQKIESEGLENYLNAEIIPFDKIKNLDENKFDAIISNFGGLNCINDFSDLSKEFAGKIKSEGFFIAAVMNRICPWEMIFYSLKFQFKTAFRRFFAKGIDANVEGVSVKTFYFTPCKFKKLFGSSFRSIKVYSLGLFTQPPYLINLYRRYKSIGKLFMKIDYKIKGIFPFNQMGDHFIIVMKKK